MVSSKEERSRCKRCGRNWAVGWYSYCRRCADTLARQDFRSKDKLVLYLHREMRLLRGSLKIIAKSLGRYEAEKLFRDQLKARNHKAFTEWRRRNPYRPKQEWGGEVTPTYKWYVSDGCSDYKLRAHVRSHAGGGHNWWCCNRRDVYFTDPLGNKWWGVHIAAEWGNEFFSSDCGTGFFSNNEVHCRKLKKQEA